MSLVNDVLGFDVHGDGLQVDFHHPIDEWDDESRPGPPFGPFGRPRRKMALRSYLRTILTAAATNSTTTIAAMANPYRTDVFSWKWLFRVWVVELRLGVPSSS